MALYLDRDIETDDAGEIQIEHGDLKLGSVKRSFTQAFNWSLLTNRGEGLWGDAMANLGVFFGSLNIPRTHRAMEASIKRALEKQRAFFPGDVDVSVVPVDDNEAVVMAKLRGTYLLQDGEDATAEDQHLAYRYPFGTGLPVKVDVTAG